MARTKVPDSPAAAGAEGRGDIAALMAGLREQMDAMFSREFEALESAVASRVAERLAGADALIARLTQENARLAEENARQARTLARLRELASGEV